MSFAEDILVWLYESFMSASNVYTLWFLYLERVYYIKVILVFLVDCHHIWIHFLFQINIQSSFVVGERQARALSYMSVEEELLFEGRDVEWPHGFLLVF